MAIVELSYECEDPVEESKRWDANHVRFTANGGYECERELAKRDLKVGQVYEVDVVCVEGMSSEYFLHAFPEQGFNTCMFEVVD